MSLAGDPGIYLHNIAAEIAGIRALTAGKNLKIFASIWGMTRAVQHALLIIAEAAKHIPDELKRQRNEVPWRKIHALGNLLRHEYRRIDPEVIWSVGEDHLPQLADAVAELRNQTSGPDKSSGE